MGLYRYPLTLSILLQGRYRQLQIHPLQVVLAGVSLCIYSGYGQLCVLDFYTLEISLRKFLVVLYIQQAPPVPPPQGYPKYILLAPTPILLGIVLPVSTICDHKSSSYGKCDHTEGKYLNVLILQYILSYSPDISNSIFYGVSLYDTLQLFRDYPFG